MWGEKPQVHRNAAPGTRHKAPSSCLQEIIFRGPHPRHLPCRCSSPQLSRTAEESSPWHWTFSQCWHSPPLHSDPFGGEEIIQSAMVRGIKSVPFSEENSLCYVTGSEQPHCSKKAGLSICVPLMFSLSSSDRTVPALRALSFSKPNKWQFEN